MNITNINTNKSKGFTIVELLIVIVVIGILAAIVIVAFNGIQNRANDTSVKSDLTSNYKALMNYQVLNDGLYVVGNPTTAMGLKYTKTAYDSVNNNAYYCASADGKDMALAGRSKSGAQFIYGTKTGLIEMTTSWGGGNACIAAGLVAADLRSNGYMSATTTWSAWTN